MPTILNPYISFKDNARQALEFYHSVFGGKLALSTFKEFGAAQNPADADLVMHGQLDTPGGLTLMCADTPSFITEYDSGSNITISLSGEDEAELTGYYQKLSAGGTVEQPLEKAPWGDTFGMFHDQFGVAWMVNIAGPKA